MTDNKYPLPPVDLFLPRGKIICSTRIRDHRRESRKRTAARMRAVRNRLRETSRMLDGWTYDQPRSCYVTHLTERRKAVRELKP